MNYDDTIAAIGTPPGRGGIGVVRLSGPDAPRIASAFFKARRGGPVESQQSHTVRYGRVIDPAKDELVDEAMVTIMRAPHSYTGEDVVEISCHGGPVPLNRTLRLCLEHGARLAEPGEFTKRAFLFGRIDLAQAEAVCDLIEARTSASGRLAVQQLAGRLSSEIRSVRERLLSLLVTIDASIDFPEHDIEDVTGTALKDGILECLRRVQRLSDTAESGRVFREGIRAAIVGRPNVGKSSLMNALLGQDRAIVTEVPGTTRDLIEETANIIGVPFVLTDTAGIRATTDVVEKIGVERALEAGRTADISILVIDAHRELCQEDQDMVLECLQKPLVVVANKIDLGVNNETLLRIREMIGGRGLVETSLISGEGLDSLRDTLYGMAVKADAVMSESVVVTSARHQASLIDTRKALERALDALETGVPYDMLSIDLRSAAEALGRITGESVAEDVLEQIFSRFCIGK